MRRIILISILLFSVYAFSQTLPNNAIFEPKGNKVELLNKGNEYYKNGEYKKAEQYYLSSLNKDEEYYKANINMAHSLLKQGIADKDSDKLNQAEILYKKSISVSETKKEKAISYGNLGNSQLLNQKIEKSIDSYKNSLRLVPENQEIKHNLALAQALLKKEKDKEEKQQNDKNEEDEEKEKEGKGEEKEEKGENEKDEGKEEEKKEKGVNEEDQENKKEDNQEGDQQENNQERDQQENNPGEELSNKEIEQILNALEREEKNVQEDLQEKKKIGIKGSILKDW